MATHNLHNLVAHTFNYVAVLLSEEHYHKSY